jgi:hypothetical protein
VCVRVCVCIAISLELIFPFLHINPPLCPKNSSLTHIRDFIWSKMLLVSLCCWYENRTTWTLSTGQKTKHHAICAAGSIAANPEVSWQVVKNDELRRIWKETALAESTVYNAFGVSD